MLEGMVPLVARAPANERAWYCGPSVRRGNRNCGSELRFHDQKRASDESSCRGAREKETCLCCTGRHGRPGGNEVLQERYP